MVPALVLTAGLATRLRPLSLVRAKAAVPVAGEALAQRILTWLGNAGVTDAVLNLHHLPHTLTRLIGDGAGTGIRVRYSWEVPMVLGSAGGPRRALSLLGASTFLIVNGDTLTEVDLAALVNDHRESGALVTMAVIPNTEPQKYSGIRMDSTGVFRGVVPRGSTETSFHFVGVQVAEAAAFAHLSDTQPFESVAALYPSLVRERPAAVRGFVTSGEFMDIGTPADYLDTSLKIAAREGAYRLIGNGTTVASTARVERSVLWDHVAVSEGAMLRECIVTDGVQVPADTSWHGVTRRVADGQLADGERVIGELAIAAI
jgi:NDP-sugar pyrophosphorylase family protein